VQALRTAGPEIRLTGFDNTRTLGALSFTFLDAAGNGIGTGAIRTDAPILPGISPLLNWAVSRSAPTSSDRRCSKVASCGSPSVIPPVH
jgi:hypothetical protein